MPVRIPTTLPARTTLERENIFVMGYERAKQQDIRALRVAILNLMPTKVETETQLLRLLGNSALQVEITLLQTASYQPKNTASDHLLAHYRTWDQVREIAKAKMKDMNTTDVEQAAHTIAGTARSMGVEVE